MPDGIIDAVIVCYNSDKWIEKCLKSLFKQSYPLRNIYLIDNYKSNLQLISRLVSEHSGIKYIKLKKNLNYGGANNFGMSRAIQNNADYVLVINPDLWLEKNAINEMVTNCISNQKLGIVSGLQLQYDSDSWSDWAIKHIHTVNDSKIINYNWLEGSCMLFTKKVINAIGGFDPIYQMYYEDMDICRRTILADFDLSIVMNAKYHHYSNASYEEKLNPIRLTRIDTSQFIFNLTNPHNSWSRNLVKTFRWFVKKCLQWITGKRPGFSNTIFKMVRLTASDYELIKNNWKNRKSGKLKVELSTSPELVEMEL